MSTERPPRPLLTVKHTVPPPRQGRMVRQHLLERLSHAETPVTAVVAPAGWGKTSLLSQWATDAGQHARVAWVSLDESDDEPVRFWTYVLTAVTGGGEVSDASLRALDATSVAPVELALPMLLNELTATTVRHVLVLDDYHVIRDSRIHEAVEFLVSYLPPSLRVVIAGRADPPLPLARWRGRGQLTELRVPQLRFLPDEAGTLLAAVSGHDTDESTAKALWERTEGWPAGLQLAALAMRADPTKVRGDDRHVLDYFTAEVLPSLSADQRDLLVRCAPLERLSGPLCDAVLGTTGSAGVLADLVRADLFVAALDDQQQWFRCHALLRDALSLAAADTSAVLAGAAAWFAAEDRVDDAVTHLLRAGRHEDAAELLRDRDGWFFERGAVSMYLRLGERVSISHVGPSLAYSLAFAAALCGDQARVNRWLDLAEATGDAGVVLPGWHSFRGAVLTVRAGFGMTDAEAGQAVTLARQALELETDGDGAPHPHVPSTLGGLLARDGHFDEAASLLLEVWARPDRRSWPPWTVIAVAGMLAISLVETGHLEECDRILRDVEPVAESLERDGRQPSAPGLAAVRIASGRRTYLDSDVQTAAVLLRHAVELAELHPRPTTLCLGQLYLADAELANGDRPAALTAVSRARELVDEEPVSAFVVRRLEEVETRLGRRAARAAVRSGALVEELTDRELSVLRALQGSATQREIGAALFLSINTVKAYSKSLYRKLGVASRQDAVATGRHLGLI